MRDATPLVFIDTNVWFSAFYGSENSEKLIKAHIRGDIQAIISRQVLKESVKNVSSKIPNVQTPLKRLLVAAPPVITPDPEDVSVHVSTSVDKKDQGIFQAAINAKVRLFVTGKIKDFNREKIKKTFNMTVVSPKEAIAILKLSLAI